MNWILQHSQQLHHSIDVIFLLVCFGISIRSFRKGNSIAGIGWMAAFAGWFFLFIESLKTKGW